MHVRGSENSNTSGILYRNETRRFRVFRGTPVTNGPGRGPFHGSLFRIHAQGVVPTTKWHQEQLHDNVAHHVPTMRDSPYAAIFRQCSETWVKRHPKRPCGTREVLDCRRGDRGAPIQATATGRVAFYALTPGCGKRCFQHGFQHCGTPPGTIPLKTSSSPSRSALSSDADTIGFFLSMKDSPRSCGSVVCPTFDMVFLLSEEPTTTIAYRFTMT